MSFPGIPNISPTITITREDAINLLLTSIALEEIGLSRILNAEGEKIQYVLGMVPGVTGPGATIDDILAIDKSVKATMDTVIRKELLLLSKLETVLNAPTLLHPAGATESTELAGAPLDATDTKWTTEDPGKADSTNATWAMEDTGAADFAGTARIAGATRTTDSTSSTGATRTVFTDINGYAANTNGSIIALTIDGTSIPLPSNHVLNGVTINGANTVITLPTAGTYMLSYQINLTAAVAVSSQLLINGVPFTPSIVNPPLSLSGFNNTVITTVGAGATVQLQLFGLLGAATLLDGGAGAALTMVRIS